MRHGQGTRYNTDVHDALSVIKKYNANQEIDEAPYSLGQRAKDTAKSWVPGGMRRMAKGRKDSGNIANDVNKQWQTHLGKAGHMNQDTATVKELSNFITQTWPGTDPSAFYKKAGITATNPDSVVPKKSQEKIILALAQSVNSGGGGSTADATSTATDTATDTATGGPKSKPVDKNRDGIDDVTNTPVAQDGGGGLDDKARAGVDLAKSATSSKSAGGPSDTTDPTDTPTSDDPNTNKVLSLDPPEVQGPKGIAWKKGTDGRWKMSVHPFKIADPKLVPELDKILSGGTPAAKPNAKQAELINFVSALDDKRRTDLTKQIQILASKVPAVGGN